MLPRSFGRLGLLLSAAAVLLNQPARAEGTTASAGTSSSHAAFGPRIGISSSPDQFVVGGQLMFPDFAPQLAAVPSVELGFLDHVTTIAINGDFVYHFKIQNSQWVPYAGAGAALVVTQYDSDKYPNTDSSTDAGMNLILGAEVPTRTGNKFFGEFRIGVGSIPSLKLIAGWNFPL
ncbi:MAG: hypothetical protein ACRENS_10535 [Candidatus Eiseniibacteriota bacterium]